jgi:hypothetical protein
MRVEQMVRDAVERVAVEEHLLRVSQEAQRDHIAVRKRQAPALEHLGTE